MLKSKKIKIGLAALALLLVIGLAAYIVVQKNKLPRLSTNPNSSAESFRQKNRQTDAEKLDSKRYENYQTSQLRYLEGYITENDYASAQEVQNSIIKSVPAKQLSVEAYIDFAKLAKLRGNTADYKKYTKLAIDELRQQGGSQEADYQQKQLDEAK